MALSPLSQRTIQRVNSGGSDNGFSRAKKLADLVIKQNPNSKAIGYQQAIEILTPFMALDGNAGIDAQRLVQGYSNSLATIQKKESNRRQTKGALELDEKSAYYAAATGVKANFIASGDIAGLVSFQRQTLNENLFRIQESIAAAEEEGDDASGLYAQLSEAHRRYKDIERLEDDLQNGDGSSLSEYGVYVDGDKNGVDGIFIAKTNDLPPGISKDNYTALDEASTIPGIAGAAIPVYGEHFVDPLDGKKKVVIGNREWSMPSGVGGALRYNPKSDPTYISNSKAGSFNVADFQIKNNPLKMGGNQYFTGITGYDKDGNLVRTLFKSPDGQNVYSIDEETKKMLEADPIEGPKIANAYKRNEMDSRFIRESVIPNAKPYKMGQEPKPLAMPPMTIESLASGGALRNIMNPQPTSFFGNRTNTPTPPQETAVGDSPDGIIEQGKNFFRKAAGFFSK